MTEFAKFLSDRLEASAFSTEDVLSSFLPLAREVLDAHAAGYVAPLRGIDDLHVDGVRIWFEESNRQSPQSQDAAIRRLDHHADGAVEVVTETRRTTNTDEEPGTLVNLAIGNPETTPSRPVYLPGYCAWEHRLGHHDPLTDTFSLGMILASLACGLDFRQSDDLERFVSARRNLFGIAPGLHPVLAQTIVQMTALSRRDRAPNLGLMIRALENYRDQKVDIDVELATIKGFAGKDARSKQTVVLQKLRERLFDISRRNRLLHFQSTMQSVNLTHASVPLSFDIKNIRPDQIFVWNDDRQKEFSAGKGISLNRILNFSEALYLPSFLDRIIADTRRDRAEFGFAQLRLVACFLRWTNLKEKPIQRYASPLILLPVELRKQKGVRDTYTLEPQATDAEINPVVRHEFKRLYNIDLPATIDLTQSSIDDLFTFISTRVKASEPAVTIEKIDRPRIALLHDKARRKLDQYRRRARLAGRGVRQFMSMDYSYDPANYHPLGIKLFAARIRTPETRLRTIIEDAPRPRTFAAPVLEPPGEPPTVEKERSFFSIEEGEANPYTWQYDLCSVTLANFKYRRMSLVRDYDTLLDEQPTNPAFDAIFSLKPRPQFQDVCEAPPLAERYDVVTCDPTQASAVGEARSGTSYIIQGPPGTGKSQTITNLIADYVARNKRVLFVCEKRAAIDVVYARLRQRGLGNLCCLIHDSQTDKKEFIANLKQAYESSLADAPRSPGAGRDELLRLYDSEIAPLGHFGQAMQMAPPEGGSTLRGLLDRAIELVNARPNLSPIEKERLPPHAVWQNHRDQIQRFVATLEELQPDGVFARHPLRLLSPRVTAVDRPLEVVTKSLQETLRLLEAVDQTLATSGVPREYWDRIDNTVSLVECCRDLAPLAELDHLSLLDGASERAKQFAADVRTLREQHVALSEALDHAKAWKERLPESELPQALEQAQQLERGYFSWLKPAWWRLRGILRRQYDFGSHVVPPKWTQTLVSLQQLYEAEASVRRTELAMGEAYGIKDNVESVVERVAALHAKLPQLSPQLNKLVAALTRSPQAKKIVTRVLTASEPVEGLNDALGAIVDGYAVRPLTQLQEEVARAAASLADLPDFLQCLMQLGEVAPELAAMFPEFDLTATQLESAIADASVEAAFRRDRQVNRFNAGEHRRRTRRVADLYDQLLSANAQEICQRVKSGFQEHVRIASLPAAQLNGDQKEFKKVYNRGRRDLEHEFGKSMRFKAIRDLASGDCGEVLKDLKPVWLMSPLSVSDTLPLDSECFDVVIFDEASQITLEEAVPSLFRATQAIVVGDEMQLPPTTFFAAKQTDDEDDLVVEEDGELISYELQSNSFLNHAARNLPPTMLGWHYRSRSESLISFSNWAFYEGRLLTVPEEQLPPTGRPPLIAQTSSDAELGADELVARPISFHFLKHGVYEQRRNTAEAEYIARLVRRLLTSHPDRSIGIVAFSEAQQSEIDEALSQLAREDAQFANLYEAELEREVDGQHVGLLVKNLENIQGDERDIIILSVCYGPDAGGKMRMNFGPINMVGGEKRLNVAFSRAKRHMAVVSSIHFSDITNDFNEGAACFKNYLRYAQAVSEGRSDAATRVLHGLCRWHGAQEQDAEAPPDAVTEQLAAALVRNGFLVDRGVGQSHFRCELAVRRLGDTTYRLGILVDGESYYEQSDVLERDVMRPKLLQAFGWNVCQVFAKDWRQDPDRVLESVMRRIAGHPDVEIDDVNIQSPSTSVDPLGDGGSNAL